MAKAYWQNCESDTRDVTSGFNLDYRGVIALELIEKWGMVTGVRASDDPQGRAAYDLLPVEEVIRRAFTMAEETFAALEAKGWIRATERTMEEAHQRIGELRQITSDAEYAERSKRMEKALKE